MEPTQAFQRIDGLEMPALAKAAHFGTSADLSGELHKDADDTMRGTAIPISRVRRLSVKCPMRCLKRVPQLAEIVVPGISHWDILGFVLVV